LAIGYGKLERSPKKMTAAAAASIDGHYCDIATEDIFSHMAKRDTKYPSQMPAKCQPDQNKGFHSMTIFIFN